MGEIEIAVGYCKEIESLLEQRYGATGRGLHEKLSSVENGLPSAIAKHIRQIATVRNKVVHESGFKIDNLTNFESTCNEVIRQLGGEVKSQHISNTNTTSSLSPLDLYLQRQVPDNTIVKGNGFQKFRIRQFLISLQKPAAILFAVMGAGYGLYMIGIGAGVLGGLLGAIAGLVLFSKEAINFFATLLFIITCIYVFAIFVGFIVKFWHVGHL